MTLSQATKDNYLGEAPRSGFACDIKDDKYGLLVATLNLSQLGWYAWWLRRHGRCNDIFSSDALIEKEDKPQRHEKERPRDVSHQPQT